MNFKINLHKPLENFTDDEKEKLKDAMIKMQIVKSAYYIPISKAERKGKSYEEIQFLRYKKLEESIKNVNL